jgi:spore coat polysaccharide biosynthesis protein SpsF
MSSSRLPGKALLPIAGRPMLALVVERCAAATLGSGVVVATSARPDDDAVTALARELGVPAFRGALDDVAGRALTCAEAGEHQDFVRVSGDSPFIDPIVIDQAIDLHQRDGADLTSNTHPREYPPGMSVEVIHTAALRRALAETSDAEDREHVTPYFYKHPERFRISHLAAERPRPEAIRLTVDDADELAQADWIARRLPEPFAQAPAALIVELASQFATERAR